MHGISSRPTQIMDGRRLCKRRLADGTDCPSEIDSNMNCCSDCEAQVEAKTQFPTDVCMNCSLPFSIRILYLIVYDLEKST